MYVVHVIHHRRSLLYHVLADVLKGNETQMLERWLLGRT